MAPGKACRDALFEVPDICRKFLLPTSFGPLARSMTLQRGPKNASLSPHVTSLVCRVPLRLRHRVFRMRCAQAACMQQPPAVLRLSAGGWDVNVAWLLGFARAKAIGRNPLAMTSSARWNL